MKKYPLLAIVLILTLGLTGCNFPLAGTGSESAVQTAVAMDVALTQISATLTAVVPVISPTVEIPTAPTATPTATLTPPPTLTPTLAGVWLTVLENTNCRSGPGQVYDWVTLLAAGQQVEAVARNAANDYYYVHNPNSSSGFCWLWSQFSSLTGNIAMLPVFTPQPTPTVATPTPAADFNLSYAGIIYCAPNTAVKILIENTGSVTWQSIRIVVKDKTSSTEMTHESNAFRWYTGCTADYLEQSDLTPGEEGYVTNIPGNFTYNLDDKELKVTVTLFSENGLTGTSLTKSFTVTP